MPATRIKQVEAWLSTLPHEDPQACARAMADFLALHDREALPFAFRKQLFEHVTANARRVVNLLLAELRERSLPLDARHQAMAGLVLALLRVAVDFAERLMTEAGVKSRPWFGESPLPGLTSQFFHLQSQIMALCHQTHRALPTGFWVATHKAGLGVFETGLVGLRDPANPAATLGERYLALLLEAAADPYHFSHQERIWLHDLIARYGGLVVITPARLANQGGVYGIRAAEDKPPTPLAWRPESLHECDLVLNTAPLVRKLAMIVNQLDHEGEVRHALPVVRHPAYRELLRRLKSQWGGASQRITIRHRPAKPSQRNAMIGFYPIYRLLSGRTEPGDARTMAVCQLVNESAGGIALQVSQPSFRIKIGTLVGVGRGAGGAWHDLGMVRWFKIGSTGVLTFGVKYLQGRLLPGHWARVGQDPVNPGLVSVPDPVRGPQQPRHLVVPCVQLAEDERLEIVQGGRREEIRLAGLVERLPEVEVYRLGQVD
ncbi:MAG: hypothetical protein ACOZB0_13120 [Pseudomonadota bacterium]